MVIRKKIARRALLQFAPALALAQNRRAPPPDVVSKDMLRQALTLAGLEFADDQLAMMLPEMNRISPTETPLETCDSGRLRMARPLTSIQISKGFTVQRKPMVQGWGECSERRSTLNDWAKCSARFQILMNMSVTAKNLLAELLKGAERHLKLLGFRKTKGVYIRPLTDDAVGWIGLNAAAHRSDGRVGINPVVGVRQQRVESMFEEFMAEEESGLRPTISTAIGYLMPERPYLEWLFEPAPFDHETECGRMVRAIEVYGIPFMNSNCRLGDIVQNVENLRFISKDAAVYKLPVAYLLSGRGGSATAYVENQLKELGERKDIAAGQYQIFTSNLHLEASVSGAWSTSKF